MPRGTTKRRRKALTAAAALKLTPGKTRREIPDGRGLYLVIHETGSKSWALRYRSPGGRSVKLTLGAVDLSSKEVTGEPVLGTPLSLASARELASKYKRELKTGKDPAADKRQARTNTSDYTYPDAVSDYVDHITRTRRHWTETAALLGLKPDANGQLKATKGGLCERWRDRPITSLTEDNIFGVIDDARRGGVPGLERRVKGPSESRVRAVHSGMSAFFSWLKSRRKIKTNPVAGLKKPKPPAARERVLTDDEVKRFWLATEKLTPQFGKALRLMLLTGARRDEVAGLRRSELSDDLTMWIIPPSRTKNKKEHQLPLAPLAREIISKVESISDDLLFTITGSTAISGWSKMKPKLDKLMGEPCAKCEGSGEIDKKDCMVCGGKGYSLTDWRIHDLRRTAITGMARAGADLHVIERAVNHTSGSFGGIVGVYQKHRFADEMKSALEAWANLVTNIVTDRDDKVVRLPRKKS
jgi:integrase